MSYEFIKVMSHFKAQMLQHNLSKLTLCTFQISRDINLPMYPIWQFNFLQ